MSHALARSESLTAPSKSSASEISDDGLVEEAFILTLALRVCLIPSKESSKHFHWVNTVICTVVLLFALFSIIYLVVTSYVTGKNSGGYENLPEVTFYVYTSVSYAYTSYLARSDPGIIDTLIKISRTNCVLSAESRNFCNANHESYQYLLKSMLTVIIILIAINMVVMTYRLPSDYWYFGILYIFSNMGLFLPIPFLVLGCLLLSEKIRQLLDFLKKENKKSYEGFEENNIDLLFVMKWHDALYVLNRQWNEIISGLLTLVVGSFSFVELALAIVFAVTGFSPELLFWFCINALALIATAYPTAIIDVQNRLLAIELAALPISGESSRSLLYLSQYQVCTAKFSNSKFGIFVKGTKLRITFDSLVRIGSLSVSAVVFLGGVARVS